MRIVHTGWRSVTPGECINCGSEDDWECDGRGNVLCSCQSCPDCGILDAYGFHNPGCPVLDDSGADYMRETFAEECNTLAPVSPLSYPIPTLQRQ